MFDDMQVEGYPNNTPRIPLSARLREGTADVHDAAERSRFMTALLGDETPLALDSYVQLLGQYLPIYTALERAAATHRHAPEIATLAPAALDRAAAVIADLVALGGTDWATKVTITSATTDYVARIEAATAWPGGFVAHHYVRYLGDLSGGQIIRRILRRRLGQDDDRGLSFYVFDQIDNGVQFKKAYREQLDAVAWSDADVERIVGEARAAFELNLGVFVSLEPSADALAG